MGIKAEEAVISPYKPLKNIDEKWKIITSFVQTKGLISQHISSFDHFIEHELNKILLANSEVRSTKNDKIYLRYLKIYVDSPKEQGNNIMRPVMPHECRLRDLTYMGSLRVLYNYTYQTSDGKIEEKTASSRIGGIPIMLRSKRCHLHGKSDLDLIDAQECPHDPGGYFIINGTERVIMVQEQQSKNRIMIEKDRDGSVLATVHSSTHVSKGRASLVEKNRHIYVKHNSLDMQISVAIFLKALGMVWEQEVVQCIGTNSDKLEIIGNCLHDAHNAGVYTQNDALEYIGRRYTRRKEVDEKGIPISIADSAAEFLGKVFLCHIQDADITKDWNFQYKAVYICLMVRRLVDALQDNSLMADKDFFGNKRFELAGTLLCYLFEDQFKIYNKNLRDEADRVLSKKNSTWDFSTHMEKSDMEKVFCRAISTGQWKVTRFSIDVDGVSQILTRQSYMHTLSMMTKLSSTFDKTRKITAPRALHASQWGMTCPSETPEGESIGITKNFAILCQVTNDNDEMHLRLVRLSYNLGTEMLEHVSPRDIYSEWTVFVDGQVIGIHRLPQHLIDGMRSARRRGRIDPFVSIHRNIVHHAVYIASDGGRVCRPLIICTNGVPNLKAQHLTDLQHSVRSFDNLLVEEVVEYLDVNEENDAYIAISIEELTDIHTHLEIDPFTLLGVNAGLIPFPHHNQSPRNTYQCAMGKQAMGTVALNQHKRMDTNQLLLMYPQRPLCGTKILSLTGFNELGAGINSMVAVMSYSGYDIEDAQIHNTSSIDRGFMRCMYMKKYMHIIRPDDCSAASSFPFQSGTNLDSDGIIFTGSRVKMGDTLVGKNTERHSSSGIQTRFLGPKAAITDTVLVSPTEQNSVLVKVMTRDFRRPELGDKFSSRHGQKGVCGLLVHQNDLPFNELGMSPDIIMNPHGFPSRMTVGKLIELISGKNAILEGNFADCTSFNENSTVDVCASLVRHGFSFTGKDLFYSGTTGEILPGYVFYGPIYYQKLKHMVLDKMHARAQGPNSILTRQPVQGRIKNGGQRLGEMERDCFIGYGASMLLKERFLISSDATKVSVCQNCGFLCPGQLCQFCQHKTTSTFIMPYACKLLIQELQGMGIKPTIEVGLEFSNSL